MRRLVLAALVLALMVKPAGAFVFTVIDPWRLVYERATAELSERAVKVLANTVTVAADIRTAVRRMGRRLEVFADSRRYLAAGAPLWRTWTGEPTEQEAANFLAALNGWQPAPAQVSPVLDEDIDALLPGLAALDFQNAVLAGSIERTGAIRAARRAERDALTALEAALVSDGGLTSRAEVLNAGELVAVRQRQTRIALTAEIVASLLADTLHAREVATRRLQMQATILETAPQNVAAGSGDALIRWRQP